MPAWARISRAPGIAPGELDDGLAEVRDAAAGVEQHRRAALVGQRDDLLDDRVRQAEGVGARVQLEAARARPPGSARPRPRRRRRSGRCAPAPPGARSDAARGGEDGVVGRRVAVGLVHREEQRAPVAGGVEAADDLLRGRLAPVGIVLADVRVRVEPVVRPSARRARRGRRAAGAGRTGWPLTGTARLRLRAGGRAAPRSAARTRRAGGPGRGGCGSWPCPAARSSAGRSGRRSARPSRRARRPRAARAGRSRSAARSVAPLARALGGEGRALVGAPLVAGDGELEAVRRAAGGLALAPGVERAAARHEPQVGAELAAARVELLRVAPELAGTRPGRRPGRRGVPRTRKAARWTRARARRRRARRRRDR